MTKNITKKLPDALNPQAFPKTCGNCKRVYKDDISFLKETTSATSASSNIKVIRGANVEGAEVFLEVFRNCRCGSTLMETFHCRRDLTELGIRKREIFDILLKGLKKSGYKVEDARMLILEFIAVIENTKDWEVQCMVQ